MTNNHDRQILEVSPAQEPFFYLFLFYVVVWYTQLAERWVELTGGLRIEALVSVILLGVVLFGTSKKSRDCAGFTPYVVAYFSVLLLQVLNSWDSSHSWYVFTERVLKYSAMGLFIAYFVRTPAKLRLFIFVWLLACFKIVQEGVYGGITGSLVWNNQGIPRLHGSTELYLHPNSLSQLALGTLPYIYFLFPVVHRKLSKIGLLILLACSLYCILYTGSRTGYLGVIVLIGLIWWRLPSAKKVKLLVVVLLLLPVVIQFAPKAYQSRFMSTFEGHEAEGRSKDSRLRMYGEAWTIFLRNPLGVGVGNYPLANQHYYNYKQEVHCLYLEVLTHLGIQGFVVFMMLLLKAWLVLKSSLSRLSRADNAGKYSQADVQFMLAVGNATVAYMFIRLFVDILGMDLYGVCWWFIIGIGSVLFFMSKNINREELVEI